MISPEPSVNNIPQELRDTPRWVVWKWESRKGERTKPPYNPATGERAKVNDESTWGTFTEALDALKQNPDYAGIGFVFSDDDDLFGIDLDGCREPETGTLAPWAQKHVDDFATYAEVSPSETGVKLFCRSSQQLPNGRNKKIEAEGVSGKTPGVEAYSQKRFFTITGHVLNGHSDLTDCTAQVGMFLQKYWPDEPPDGAEPNFVWGNDEVTVTADDVIKKIRASSTAAKFERLFDDGDLSEHKQDHSSADLALCSTLAFYCGPNQPLIEQCFEQSALFRDKWESRGDYRDRTIKKALEGRTVFYDWTSTGVSDSDYGRGTFNDIGNAERFKRHHSDRLQHVHPWKKWLVWDGCRWSQDNDGTPLRLAMETVERMFRDARTRRAEQVLKLAKRSAYASKLLAMLKLAAPKMPVQPDELDTNGWLLNCPNGTVDLRDGELKPHQRWQNITKLCPTEYDPSVDAPTWERFLAEVFVDPALIAFVQRLLGYCLTGDVSEQKLAIFYGTGANGKSTLLNAFLDVVGTDYSMQAMPDFLMAKRGEAHPTEKADLFGKRFVSCVETDSFRKLSETTVKMLTGGERIRARRMREDFWEFVPTHKLVLCTNHKPIIEGTDHGIWRRLLVVPFNQRFEADQIDKKMPEKLKAESSGILAWLVRGCLNWHRDGLNPPELVASATDEYRSQEDIIGRFIAERCERSRSGAARFGDLYSRLDRWCAESGDDCPSKRKLTTWLTGHGYQRGSSKGRVYKGLAFKADAWELGFKANAWERGFKADAVTEPKPEPTPEPELEPTRDDVVDTASEMHKRLVARDGVAAFTAAVMKLHKKYRIVPGEGFRNCSPELRREMMADMRSAMDGGALLEPDPTPEPEPLDPEPGSTVADGFGF